MDSNLVFEDDMRGNTTEMGYRLCMRRIIKLPTVSDFYARWSAYKERWWIAAGLLILSLLWQGPRTIFQTALNKMSAVLSLPDHLWGKWLIIFVALTVIAFGSWRSGAVTGKVLRSETEIRAQAIKLPTLLARAHALGSELRELGRIVERFNEKAKSYDKALAEWMKQRRLVAVHSPQPPRVSAVLMNGDLETPRFRMFALPPFGPNWIVVDPILIKQDLSAHVISGETVWAFEPELNKNYHAAELRNIAQLQEYAAELLRIKAENADVLLQLEDQIHQESAKVT